MEVTREVIVDLLPVYLSGEASPATCAIMEDFFKKDPEFAQRVRVQWEEGLRRAAPSGLPPELELRSLKRTRHLLGWQKWLFGLAMAFSALGLTIEFSFRNGHFYESHFMFQQYPSIFGTLLVVSAAFWIAYFTLRHRIRHAGF